jgi:dienelactone hydrolase
MRAKGGLLCAGAAALAVAAAGAAEVETRTVEYRDGETVLEGYAALPAEAGAPRPGVLVVHEWTGLNDYARQRARDLAALGYVAFAADVYGKGVRAASTREAAALSGRYKNDRALMRSRMGAALDALRGLPGVDPDRTAAIGYCFGGTCVLELARSGAGVGAVVSFHGGLDAPRPAEPGTLRAAVLALHGAADPHVPRGEVEAFRAEMDRAGADWVLVEYGGAVHSFTNPGAGGDPASGVAYDPRAARRAWTAMRAFLEEALRPAAP